MNFRFAFLFFTVLASLSAQITGGMLNPALDAKNQPFSYFWRPDDVLGALYAPVASEVTPEGYIWTGFGELMFFTGNPLEPVNQRLRTLQRGYLPIIKYDVVRDSVVYHFRLFAADLGGAMQGIPVNFAEVEIRNDSAEPRTAFLSTGFRVAAPNTGFGSLPDYRFSQRFELIPKRYVDGQTGVNTAWRYHFHSNTLCRDGRILYSFPDGAWQQSLALGDRGFRMVRFFSGEIEGNSNPKLPVNPQTPMGVNTWRIPLKPHETRKLEFKMPLAPIPSDSPEAQQIINANPSEITKQIITQWDDLVVKNTPLRFPEQKVQQYLIANTIVNLLAMDKVGDDYIVNVNKFQYHDPYGGANVVNMITGYEYMGLFDIARRSLLYHHKVQYEDGSFHMAKYPDHPYWELFGYNLWGWARYYELTHDNSFLQEIYPGVVKAMAWHATITGQDSLGLMPPSKIGDDAFLKATRQTGQQLWTLIGLLSAVDLAHEMGNKTDEARFRAQYQTFRKAFDRQLEKQTSKSGGYIPPGMDRTLLGNDWDNLLTLYPRVLFDSMDPRVTATLQKTRNEYVEGVLRYVHPNAIERHGDEFVFNKQPTTHYWQTPNNSENSLVRGTPQDQEWAVRELYALLLHTSSTHLPGEYGTVPWSTREPSSNHNLLPQGATSGKTIELLRNMLVREQGDDLYLYSALSPAWVATGKKIELINEPTSFGPVTADLSAIKGGIRIQIKNRFRNAPQHLIIRIPWFYNVTGATVDGNTVRISGNELTIPTETKEVILRGQVKSDSPILSYDRAVEEYKREYRKRYEHFLQTGDIQP